MNIFQLLVTELFSLAVLVFALRGVIGGAADEDCRVRRCSTNGPDIRFPFWLKGKQPEHCGHPGFQLSCHRGKTMLHFEYVANTSLNHAQLFLSTQLPLTSINYTSQQIQLYQHHVNPFSVLLTGYLKLLSTSNSSYSLAHPKPFRFESNYHYHFFSCDKGVISSEPVKLVSLSGQAFHVYYFPNYPFITNEEVTLCTKIFSFVLPSISYAKYVTTNWSTPNCSRCEARGEYCKLMKNSNASDGGRSDDSTTCFPIPQLQSSNNGGIGSIKPVAGIIPSAIFVVLVLVLLLYYIIRSHRQKKDDQLKIKMFLDDYKAMKPTRYTYADIKKITSQFSDKLGQGGYGTVYKGQITEEIIVAVKLLNCDPKADGEDFINEVGTIGHIHHVNVVRLVGYCADGCNRALVYEFQPNDSLEKLKYSAKNDNSFLGWKKMQEIALGIAKGIEYLHQGCAQQILHFDIKPHNILLDQNFNPKISDFGLAKLCSKDQSIVSMTMARGTIGYIAPEVFSRNFGKVSSKSDVYSFGMLLLEMVGARNNNAAEDNSEIYYPEWIYHRLDEGGEVTIQIEKEEDSNTAKKLTIVGLWCIGWHPVDRPSMKHVIQMLERQDCPAMPPNPFSSTNNVRHSRAFANELEVISESE